MADDDLLTRLQSHQKSFEGLMSLMPAEVFYGKDKTDNEDQWQRKKQSKEEKRAARKAKLEPGAYKSALDVHKERESEHKRKRDIEDVDAGVDLALGDETTSSKKRRVEADNPTLVAQNDEEIRQSKAEKRRLKRQEKKEKKSKRKAKREAAKERKKQPLDEVSAEPGETEPGIALKTERKLSKTQPKHRTLSDSSKAQPAHTNGHTDADDKDDDDNEDWEDEEELSDNESGAEEIALNNISFTDLGNDGAEDDVSPSSASPTPVQKSPMFDISSSLSSASSTSSIVPPSNPDDPAQHHNSAHELKDTISQNVVDVTNMSSKDDDTSSGQSQPKHPEEQPGNDLGNSSKPTSPGSPKLKLPAVDHEVLRARLEARISALRAARKADGPDGKPARSRQELIEARRQKAEARKQHKKELRKQAKMEQEQKKQLNDAEAEAARLRGGSGSPLWGSASKAGNNFSYGNVKFDDGAQVDASGSGLREAGKKKGPSDTKTALEAAEKKKARVAGYDAEKRADIEEKDRWLNARKRVQGEKVRDDVSLLKKTLKRKEKTKQKSEKDWTERIEGVKKSQEARQQKRTENIQKRREEKGKGKEKGRWGLKMKAGGAKPKQKRRPGFEGTFKTSARRTV